MFKHHFKIDYIHKYLKYKNKYINLKQYGSSSNLKDDIYIYGDWEHIFETNQAIDINFKKLGYPEDKIGNVLYFNPINNNLEIINNIIVFDEDDLSENKILAELDIEKTITKVINFFKNKGISSKLSKDKQDQILIEEKLAKEQQELSLKIKIKELEEKSKEREIKARKLEEEELKKKDKEKSEREEIIRIHQVAKQEKIKSNNEKNKIIAECKKIKNKQICNNNINCYFNIKTNICNPKIDKLKKIAERLASIHEVKQVKIFELHREGIALEKKKEKILSRM